MSMEHQTNFIIIRRDLRCDSITIVTETLLLGRSPECGLLLNHPSISLVQGGIRIVRGTCYFLALEPSNPVKLNGQTVESNQALASGDILSAGPFSLRIDRNGRMLNIEVSHPLETTPEPDNTLSKSGLTGSVTKSISKPRRVPLQGDKALDFYWDVRIREVATLVRRGPLFPKTERSRGKALFNWRGTSDLYDRSPLPIFVWSAILGAFFLIVWAYS